MQDNMSDRQLVERLRDGDVTAVPELQTTYGARICQLAFRYMKNREDAEEVMQDVLLRVFRKIDAFRGDAAPLLLDLPDYLQHGDVPSTHSEVSPAGRGAAGDGVQDRPGGPGPVPRGGRLVRPGR